MSTMKFVSIYFASLLAILLLLPIGLILIWFGLIFLWLLRGMRIMRWFGKNNSTIRNIPKTISMYRKMTR